MSRPVAGKTGPAPRRRFLRRAGRALAVLPLLALTALVWGFMLQRLADRVAAVSTPPPGRLRILDPPADGKRPDPARPRTLADLSCLDPLGGCQRFKMRGRFGRNDHPPDLADPIFAPLPIRIDAQAQVENVEGIVMGKIAPADARPGQADQAAPRVRESERRVSQEQE